MGCGPSRFYDEALGDKGLRKLERRGRRDFSFITPGYFERAAENARLRVRRLFQNLQLGKGQGENFLLGLA